MLAAQCTHSSTLLVSEKAVAGKGSGAQYFDCFTLAPCWNLRRRCISGWP